MEHENDTIEDSATRTSRKRRSSFSDDPSAADDHTQHSDTQPEGDADATAAESANGETKAPTSPDQIVHEAKRRAIDPAPNHEQAPETTEAEIETDAEGKYVTRISVAQSEAEGVNFIELLKAETEKIKQIETDTEVTIALKGRDFEDSESTTENAHIALSGSEYEAVSKAKAALHALLSDESVRQLYRTPAKETSTQEGAADEAEKPIWYYVDKKTTERSGPVTFSTMRKLYASKDLDEQSYIWNETLDGWKFIHELPALRDDLAKGDSTETGSNPSFPGPVPASATPVAGESVTIRIPNHLVGLFIGRGGAHIKDFEARYQVKIQPQKEAEMHPGSQERELTITGAKADIDRARSGVLAWVQEAPSRPPSGGHGSNFSQGYPPANYRPGPPVSDVMYIPNSVVGYLIGKSGAKIAELQQRSGARIQAAKENEVQPGSDLRPVYLSGDHQQIFYARQLVDQTVHEAHMKSNGSGSFGPPGVSNTATEEYNVPTSAVGFIIGRAGAKIHELNAATGAKIHLIQNYTPPAGVDERAFSITGTQEQREYAKSLLKSLVDEKITGVPNPMNRNLRVAPGAGMPSAAPHAGMHQQAGHGQHGMQTPHAAAGWNAHQAQQPQQHPGYDYQAYSQGYSYGSYGAYPGYDAHAASTAAAAASTAQQYPGYYWNGQQWVYTGAADPSGASAQAMKSGAQDPSRPAGSS
eukprot:TRINITY_DN4551_c0_g3_i1.p1 TRINITY_DN4551_c0_g3~~TRINITY_DN4551_c0_g3_i1.p1  ORF type:complete len:700 (+),score=117.92 TRINITY_DN4551_c0_g3_i1:70-2169(+)